MTSDQTNVLAVLARVYVDDLDQAVPLYRRIAGTDEVRWFAFAAARLAWVGPFLIIEGADEAIRSRAATLLVRSVEEVVSVVRADGGVIVEGPAPGPNGARLIARHRDGNVLEYIQPT